MNLLRLLWAVVRPVRRPLPEVDSIPDDPPAPVPAPAVPPAPRPRRRDVARPRAFSRVLCGPGRPGGK